jgi:hypothetical protein
MSQVFSKSANTLARASLVAVVLGGAVFGWLVVAVPRSDYITRVGVPRAQPVPFSHAHHVGGMGFDCRYCHTSVEDSSFANIPPTKTCMNCHSQLFTTVPMLEPVRASFRSNQPLSWVRVHDLPDFVYFNHSIHVAKGVGCATCHGPVDRMPLMYKENTLQMEWCLNCHRHPEQYVRPRNQVFNMQYEPPAQQEELGRRLVKEYNIAGPEQLTSCSTCHR